MFKGIEAEILAGGHTHIQMLKNFGKNMVINPGSVGLPFSLIQGKESNVNRAEYAVVEYKPGRFAIEFVQVEFDLEELKIIAMESKMPHASWWVREWEEV